MNNKTSQTLILVKLFESSEVLLSGRKAGYFDQTCVCFISSDFWIIFRTPWLCVHEVHSSNDKFSEYVIKVAFVSLIQKGIHYSSLTKFKINLICNCFTLNL